MNFGRVINHSIVIKPSANNGFSVEVGCCCVVYIDKIALIADLEEFLDNPKETETKYNKLCAEGGPPLVAS